MNFARYHRLPLAWMLLAFILFNGLACSIGHGQMLGAFCTLLPGNSHGPAMSGSGDMPAEDMDMAGMPAAAHADDTQPSPMKMGRDGGMQSMFGDCSFAGTLTLAMVFFVALGWLLRTRQLRLSLPLLCLGSPSRHSFPGLNPQAP